MLRPRRPLLPSNNLPSPATLFRCSFIAPPSSRVQDPGDDDVLGTIPVELARGMGNEIANTVPVYVSPVYIARPCCLRSFRLFRLVCRPPIPSYLAIPSCICDGLASLLSGVWGELRWIDFVKGNSFQTFLDRIYFRIFLQKMDRIYTFTPSWFFSVGKDFYPSSF